MRAPERLVAYLRERNYHPRSNAHGNAICLGVVEDLIEQCPAIGDRARKGRLVAALNHTVRVGHDDWNIDLAIGPPAGQAVPPEGDEIIVMGPPSVIEIAVEAKAVMTEHHKARRNRLRDFQAFHRHAHEYNPRTVAGVAVIVNASPVFWSPTRPASDITRHKDIAAGARTTVDTYRSLPFRTSMSGGHGLEALTVIVVEHDNLRLNPRRPEELPESSAPRLISGAPAPAAGDPLHYATFVRRMCEHYKERFGA